MLGWQAVYAHARKLEKKDDWQAAAAAYERLLSGGESGNAKVVFRLGHAYFRLDRLDEARPLLERAVILHSDNGAWHYRLGFVLERQKNFSAALISYRRALELEPTQSGWRHRAETCESALAQSRGAEVIRAVETLAQSSAGDAKNPKPARTVSSVDESPSTAPSHARSRGSAAAQGKLARIPVSAGDLLNAAATHAQNRLDDVLKNKGATWQLIEVLEDGLDSHSDNPRWAERLGDAHFKMGRYAKAAEAYGRCTQIRPDDATFYFKKGWAWQMAGNEESAETAYKKAVELDTRLGAREFGVGVFFQARGQWPLAVAGYEKAILEKTASSELYYRLGIARQKTYDWAGAAESFSLGLASNPMSEKFHWRLGLSYERLGQLKKAEEAYERSLSSVLPGSSYWKYRLGHVLRLQGKFREAAVAYYLSTEDSEALSSSAVRGEPYLVRVMEQELELLEATQSASNLKDFGLRAESLGCYQVAAKAYTAATARTSNYDADAYFRLGRASMLAGKDKEAAAAFAEIRQFKRPHAMDTGQYMKNKAQRQVMFYTEYMETLDIQADTILYESGHGAAVSGNPLQLFRNIIHDQRFAGFKHVWVLNDGKSAPAELIGRPDVIFAPRDSDLYLRYLATAGYLINDNTFPPYFIRRDEQKYLNTWHGTPLKTLGRDIKNGVMDHKNAARNFLHATHMIAPNQFTADCLLDKYDVAGLYSGRIAVTGYPRIDATINASDERRSELRRQLGVPAGKKIVLYAPTWRGSLADKSVDKGRLLKDVQRLSSGGWHFLYRGHNMTSDQAGGDVLAGHTVPESIDTNDLLAVVDVLVTDYSSIFFDFIPKRLPIIYYAYDLDEYVNERGLYFELDAMPGTVCTSVDGVFDAINGAVSSEIVADADSYAKAEQDFCPKDDGHASRRAIDFFFFDADEWDISNKQDAKRNVLLFQGSFLPNGITTSYLNLVAHIDQDENNVYVVVDPDALASQPERLDKFAQNPSHVRVLARVGNHVVTPEERWVIDKLNTQHDVSCEEMWQIIDRAFAREFRRVFGTASFDSVICFEGYARFWAALLGNAPLPSAKKSVYLHNDMYREWQNRFEYLEANFRLFRKFDSLISVTESVAIENASQLSERFQLEPAAFTFCNNLVNPEETLRLAAEPLDHDIADWVKEGETLFVTLGRLSPEKGHAKLIHAFAEVAREQPSAKLAILGDGPLHESLQQLIDRLGLHKRVMLAGRRMNPFAVLRNADCFVFSSDYEGQGLVVLEALILDRPVISTDVVGPRSVLEGGYGLLVENSVHGLATGLHRFFRGEIPHEPFDYEVYQKEALEKFGAVAL